MMLHRRQEPMVGDEESLKKRKIKDISIVYIPEDVLVEILLRLTVKSLMQLRCVCKVWRDLIRRPDFISKHHLMQTTLQNVNLIVSHGRCFFSLLSSCSDVDDTLRVAETIQIEDKFFLRDLFVMGPCNGLICLAHKCNIERIFLWNPATREYKHLPLSTVELRARSEDGTLGFGFDSKNDDFKVLRIPTIRRSGYRGFNYIEQVELYSLKSDSWKQIPVVGMMIPSNIYVECSHVYHAGIQYWSAELKYVQMLLSFDYVDEVLELVPYVGSPHNFMSTLDLGIFNGSLASIHGELGCRRKGKCFDIWVMTEHEVKDRWVRMIRIGPFPEFRPLGFWKNCVVFSQSDSMILYDMNTQKLKNVPVAPNFPRCYMPVANYVESLVPIKGSRKENIVESMRMNNPLFVREFRISRATHFRHRIK